MTDLKKCDKYKPSMFNLLCNDEKKLIIYNSYVGIKSIHIIPPEKTDKVQKILTSDYVYYDNDSDVEKLILWGFLVPQEADENLRREALFEEICNNNHLHLLVYVTNDCNFRCKYCALDFEKKSITLNVQNGIIEFIRKNIHRYTSVSIDWFGGEPLLEVDSIVYISKKVIDICKKANKPYSGSITSNGFLLNPIVARKLIDCNIISYTITIDGIKETHDNQRVLIDGSGSFEKIVDNLLWMKNNIKTKTLNIIIRTNITKEIMANVSEYYSFYNDTFGNDSRFSLFVRPASDWGGDRVKNFYNSLIDENDLADAYKTIFNNTYGILFERNIGDIDVASSTCSATFKNKFTIDINGKIYKCDDADDRLCVGYLTENGKMVLDHDKVLFWQRGYRKNRPECLKCFYSGSCFFGACPKTILMGKGKSCVKKEIEAEEIVKYAAKVLHVESL